MWDDDESASAGACFCPADQLAASAAVWITLTLGSGIIAGALALLF